MVTFDVDIDLFLEYMYIKFNVIRRAYGNTYV